MISASPSPRVSNAGAGSMQHRIDVENFAGAIGDDADGATSHREHHDLAGILAVRRRLGKPSSARNETSGSSRSRKVTTPSTAVSDRATSAILCRAPG